MNSALQFTLSKFETETVFVWTSPGVRICVYVYEYLDVCIFTGQV